MSLVSRKLYGLVRSPHAWRVAFARFFPGQDALDAPLSVTRRGSDQETREGLVSEKRFFTRLTGLASWRSEYILRTRLLRSLARGKPAQIAAGHGASSRANSAANNANAVVTYSSQLFATVNHIHATFGNGKRSPRFVHGTDETGTATTSDPNIGKIDAWGLGDPQALPQFADLFIGELPYGMGDGPAGQPNVMDVSQPYGMIYGEGFPGGQVYFRSSEEQRGRFLGLTTEFADHKFGIPRIHVATEAISSVWIAKTNAIPTLTDGLVGALTGSTLGVITAYSLGTETAAGRRIARGQATARWVLSPGVPITSIKVDDFYSFKRKAKGRVWAVALNALGEIFYLVDTPHSSLLDAKVEDSDYLQHAWKAGRSAYWQLVEPSRRVAKDDPFNEFEVHGSYSPRSSADKMHLSKSQLVAETSEVEKFLRYRPSHFRKICEGWDMRQRMEVDFAGDDENGAGESVVVIRCGVDNAVPDIRRFTRCKSEQASLDEYPVPKTPPTPHAPTMASLFGGGLHNVNARMASTPRTPVPVRSMSVSSYQDGQSVKVTNLVEEWKQSRLTMGDRRVEILCTALDISSYASLTADEDPLSTINGQTASSSPFATPATPSETGTTQPHIPGHRARFFAVGTKTGDVIVWNMRGSISTQFDVINELHPVRTIHTDSPQISCLAISALYIVVGGNDGLVQAWDPLASSLQPVRTLNSRFSSRARRRLIQAEASIHGVGINLYAAGAIALDPDPTVLRGMVSLGTHLRYWAYSSSAADQYQSKKRRLRRSGERGNNSTPDRYTNTGRGALMDYIATEQEDLRQEKLRRNREEARLLGRFGVGLGGLTDEEALKYAELVSAEAFQKDEERRMSDAMSGESVGDWSSATATPEGSVMRSSSPQYKTDDELESDIEKAIRLSLLDGVDESGSPPRASGSGCYDIPIVYKQKKLRRSASSSPSTSQASRSRAKPPVAADDLEFALQLSLAEERSRGDGEYPALESKGKGKGRAA